MVKGEDFASQQAGSTIENRDNFRQFCMGNELCVMNTYFGNSERAQETNPDNYKRYCTYKEMNPDGWARP